MAQKKLYQISFRIEPDNDEWLRNYLYYKQINSGNIKISITDVVNEAIECLKDQKSHLPVFPRPDFIRQTEQRPRRIYKPREK